MASTLRLPQIDLKAVLSQQHPSIDLRVHTYENSTRNFLKALTSYKDRAITTISERRKHQALERKKALDRTQAVEAETNQCKLREVELVAQLEREKEERKDAELSVAAFKRQLATLRDKIASVDTDIEQYRVVTQNLKREKNKERATLRTHASQLEELSACEDLLGFMIEGVEKDQLLVRFTKLDASDPEREATFVIDVGGEFFRVITCSPLLPSMSSHLNNLNESRDLYAFIRDVRMAYSAFLNPRSKSQQT
ncbi:hypothetical protein D9619_010754 [Psilocybe cf. subviscida]|uniref:Kinetochore protein SPC25 n=1 Tax=Psilocybe cf. subviscida TaxID=2480587 RepID=A0A8H5F032_9AGAR|nr:hypothetical protein D9619_010754 [Psilocybe cf. subviscida]